ncbi:MAG: M1 family metallopeptidase [Wenzhouxiangellaceae bacterium]|nr:M1 family metallopeptidase [Wenzhouxiangellaceae bacterium]
MNPSGVFKTLLLLLAALLLAACGDTPEVVEPIAPGDDPHSFANFGEVRVAHIALDLAVDFDRRRLDGHAVLNLEPVQPSGRLVLDTRDLEIVDVNRVEADGALAPLSWRLNAPVDGQPWLGQALVIALGSGVERVRVDYRTSPEAYGLQWLDGQQTTSGEPFLFTQSQPIFARSWVPLQDTPAVRYTFEATLRVPRHLMATMGAAGNPTATHEDGIYTFEMPQAIPSYLMALAVGRLEFEATGPRSGVYAEPSRLAAAADEFAELEAMIDAGEALYGPYRWDRYDLLILPPSFPFGGMENPRLSFITPTVIAGDRSLTALIAHELAHSWSGNLVTNAEWRDLWLNEGFTTYFENRIVEALYGDDRAEAEATLDIAGLVEEMEGLPEDAQVLVRDLAGEDPEGAFTGVPYDKGRLFLDWLEAQVGRERFDRFLAGWFEQFAFQSVRTEDFLGYLQDKLVDGEAVTMEQVRTWLHQPGLPAFAVLPSSDAFETVDDWRRRWLDGDVSLDALPVDAWSVSQWRHFLTGLTGSVDQARMVALDEAFALTASGNVEILYLWLQLAIETRYQPGIERLEGFLLEVGRNKFTRPLYQALADSDWGRDWAIEVYRRARAGYHPMTRQAAERALGIEPEGAS